MRSVLSSRFPVALFATLACAACSSSSSSGFGDTSDGGSSTQSSSTGGFSSSAGTGDGGGSILNQSDAAGGSGGDGGGSTVTTIYADTDTELYTLDPQTNQVTMLGTFSGFGGGSGDTGATDIAVNAEGDVYVNSESVVYKATLPASGGNVALTKVASIAVKSSQSFYALAFAPAGVLGSGETLVGGDNNGELWSIDTASGATVDLGTFGADPSESGYILSLSGDIVFYLDATGAPTGLATIRSCKSSGSGCGTKDDYLAGIDMTALIAAYKSGTPSSSLLAGVYGGGTGNVGNGTGYGELFGLGAWEGTVFGFGHSPANLVTISTSTGIGSLVSSAFSSGWAGAGVSTKTTITVAAPPASK